MKKLNASVQQQHNLKLNFPIKLWDEFSPNRYKITVSLQNENQITTNFGFRSIAHSASKILINDAPVFYGEIWIVYTFLLQAILHAMLRNGKGSLKYTNLMGSTMSAFIPGVRLKQLLRLQISLVFIYRPKPFG
ncbi:hypothetical protein [Pedobacter steynii]